MKGLSLAWVAGMLAAVIAMTTTAIDNVTRGSEVTHPSVIAESTRAVWRIEHAFAPATPVERPFDASYWAILECPADEDGAVAKLTIPAFHDGDNVWRIRYRPTRMGLHRVLSYATGPDVASLEDLDATPIDDTVFDVEVAPGRGLIRPSNAVTQRFEFDNGEPYFPIGYNVAWEAPPHGYAAHFALMQDVGLNWSRVWMAHWAGMNLDWVMGKKMEDGELDLQVARRWDAVVEAAEEHGVYFQFVLQHHGQVSTWVNPNWHENPWNAANGGWLESPSHFFTDERARRLTRQKYRYIVARWGYSPSIMAWELFNEVELTDGYVERGLRELWELANRHGNFTPKLDTGGPSAYGDGDENVAHAEQGVLSKLTETWEKFGGSAITSLGPGIGQRRVAEWHHEMAAHLRALDVTGRMVTTSSAPLGSLIWRDMDYYQSHLYHREMITPVARIPGGIENYDKPVFVGEMGDHEILDPAKRDGRYMAPMLWAGLFSGAAGAAQMWAWETVSQNGLDSVFASMTRFIREAGFGERHYQVTSILAGGDDSIVALAMHSPDRCVVWLHDRESIGASDGRENVTTIELAPDIVARVESIQWYDPKAGQFVDAPAGGNHTSVLITPPFTGHIAGILILRNPS